ncbi:MAG: thermonuclease family protein [Mycobacterium sp.]
MIGVAIVAFGLTLNWPVSATRPLEASQVSAAPLVVPRGTLRCEVAYVNDGDTLRCRDGTRIRLHAVAARESNESCSPGHPCPAASGAAATRELERLTGGRAITCEPTGRSYDRITAICWTPAGEEVNCAMVRSGTTLIWDRFNRERALCRPG